MKHFFLIPLVLVLAHCSSNPRVAGPTQGQSSSADSGQIQEIINVSAYDPKARARSGSGYSQNDVTALRANGSRGLIARAGKGGNLDDKCSSFIKAADRAGLLAGVYYRVQKHVSPVKQADQFVNRAISLTRSRPSGVAPLLLCGDYDGDLTLAAIVAFQDRVEQRTGRVPVAYLENSQDLKLKTRAADAQTRAKLRRAPYWLALYSHTSGKTTLFPPPGKPGNLVKQYRLWSDWTLWQYGGVGWENGASEAKVYNHGSYRFPKYFGNMDRPMERNIFRGSYEQLLGFWSRHGMPRR